MLNNQTNKSLLKKHVGCKETKHAKFSKKADISYLVGGKNCSSFGKFAVFCVLVTTVLRFAILPHYQQSQ